MPMHDGKVKTEITPDQGGFLAVLRDVWTYRELVGFLVWRDVLVRYKQNLLGVSWALLQPAALMLVFTAIFSHMVNVPSEGVPYPLFAFCALLPWNYFAGSISRAGTSVVGNANLVTKVYFPRVIIPLAATLGPLVDFAVSFLLLIGLMIYYQTSPGINLIFLPFFIGLALVISLGCSLWLSALHVRYRDVHHVLPLFLQTFMYALPIAYPLSLVPAGIKSFYWVNPLVSVVEGFRWAILQTPTFPGRFLISASLLAFTLLLTGLWYFQSVEGSFSDEI